MTNRRKGHVILAVALLLGGLAWRASHLFRTENELTTHLALQTSFAWGYPQRFSIRPRSLPRPRVEYTYYQPDTAAILAAVVGLGQRARYPILDRERMVDWDMDGNLDLRVVLPRAERYHFDAKRDAFIRRSPGQSWTHVAGRDAETVIEAVDFVRFNPTFDLAVDQVIKD